MLESCTSRADLDRSLPEADYVKCSVVVVGLPEAVD